MSNRVLLTGGAGYIGSVLTQLLLTKGYKVTIIDTFRFSENSLNHLIADKNLDVLKIDARSISKEILSNQDFIIPLAAIVGAPACQMYQEEAISINRDSILKILQNISDKQNVIFPTTNSGYGTTSGDLYCDETTPLNPISLYGKLKKEIETTIMERENAVCFRLATVFGVSPRHRRDLLVNDFVFKAIKDKSISLFEPNFKRNYVHIKDVARAYLFAIENFDKLKGDVYNLGMSDANLSKLELCNKIKNYVKDLEIFISKNGSDPDKRNYIVSNEKIEKKGYNTEYTLDDGIKELIKYYLISTKKNTNI
jgi:nucleoside-diphosphate-sugar epimerase